MRKAPWFICGLHNRIMTSTIRGRDLRSQSLDFCKSITVCRGKRSGHTVILVWTDESVIRKMHVVCFAGPAGDIYMFKLCDGFFLHYISVCLAFLVKMAVQCEKRIVKVRFKLQRTIKCGMESVPECKVV